MGQGYDPRSIIGRYRKLPSGELIEAAYMRTRRDSYATNRHRASLLGDVECVTQQFNCLCTCHNSASHVRPEGSSTAPTNSFRWSNGFTRKKMEAQPVAGLKFSLPSLDQDPGKDGTNPTSERRFLLSLSRTAISIHFGLRSKVSLHSCGFVFTGERRVWL